jgi:TIR domain
MPLAKDVVGVEDALVNLLQHIPGTKEEKQAYFRSRSIQVPRTNYVSMWEGLAGRLHRSGAASAIFELLRTKMPDRVSDLLRTAKQGRPVTLDASDPAIVDDLFFLNGKLRKLGELFLAELESRGDLMGPAASNKSAAVFEVLAAAEQHAAASALQPKEVAKYDFFLSHAWEDKETIARPLYGALTAAGVSVWFDEAELKIGDSLRMKIDDGLARCKFGIVIISPNFLNKEWTQRELDGLVALEVESGKAKILPIWHQIDKDLLLRRSPVLADRMAGKSSEGVARLAKKILSVIEYE